MVHECYPTTSEMMREDDQAFVEMLTQIMAGYAFVLPCHCQKPGCVNVITSPGQLRKHSGDWLCPACFVQTVFNRLWQYREPRPWGNLTDAELEQAMSSTNPINKLGLYHLRVAALLPSSIDSESGSREAAELFAKEKDRPPIKRKGAH